MVDFPAMDGVAAILAALGAGVGAGLNETAKDSVLDLRDKIKARFESDHEATSRLNDYTRSPTQETAALLITHIEAHGLHRDDQILDAAQAVLHSAGPTAVGPGAVKATNITQNISDHGTAFVGGTQYYANILNQAVARSTTEQVAIPALMILVVGVVVALAVLVTLTWGARSEIAPPKRPAPTTAAVPSTRCSGEAEVFGILDDGQLTYTRIKGATNQRISMMIGENSGLRPAGLAALSPERLLVIDRNRHLYRVDIWVDAAQRNITLRTKVDLGVWNQDPSLAFDGKGSLYGIKGDLLMEYAVSATTPDIIGEGKAVGRGFRGLESLAAPAPNYVIGIRQNQLLGYQVGGTADLPEVLGTSWNRTTRLVTPGQGLFYGRGWDDSLNTYRYFRPLHRSRDAIRNRGQVDERGWSQSVLSAVPNTLTCSDFHDSGASD